MRTIVSIALVILFAFSGLGQGMSEAQYAFLAGNEAYQAGNYEEALTQYLSIDNDHRSFSVEYNTGNAYFKLDSIGKAILYYERAKVLDPSNEELKVNLQLANQRIVDKIESLPNLGVRDLWGQLVSANALPTWTWISLISIMLAFGCFIAFLLIPSRQVRRIFILVGVFFAISYLLSYLMARQVVNGSDSNEAIIMAPKVEVKSEPSETAVDVFILHEGTKVELRQEQGDWYEVRIANGSVGWMKKGECEGV